MEKLVNNFLNRYLGDEIVVKKITRARLPKFFIVSKKTNKVIIWFIYQENSNKYTLFRSDELVHLVSDFFSTDEDESTKLIKYWFGDKHRIKKVGDLSKFREMVP